MCLFKSPEGNISPRVIVQGGVYRSMDPGLKEEYERVTKQSAREGYATLMVSNAYLINIVFVTRTQNPISSRNHTIPNSVCFGI